jgi:tRNA (guanine37-N1)-methyltransferase
VQIDVLSIFPEAVEPYLAASIVGRARRRGLVDVDVIDPRQWAGGRYKTIDDRSFGGGPGMVIAAPPVAACLDYVKTRSAKPRLLMTSPQGRRFDQTWAQELAEEAHVAVLCGHYEGIDERIVELYEPELVSVGDVVLSGGELAALLIVDAVVRLIPGALGNAQSAIEETNIAEGAYDHPCYTRPREFRGLMVPEALLSGDHAKIEQWRAAERDRRRN